MRHDEAIRRSIALHCTTWVSAESILLMGLLPGALMGGKRTHIHLTTYPLNTQGFVEVRGHRPYAIAVDLVKCLHAGVALYIAGGETVLTSWPGSAGRPPLLHFCRV